MKKAILIVTLFYFFSILGIAVNALGQNQSTPSAPIKKAVYVDGRSRTAIIFTDKDGLHIQYFTDNSMQFLGEEIFKNGEKTFDSYKENDGLRD